MLSFACTESAHIVNPSTVHGWYQLGVRALKLPLTLVSYSYLQHGRGQELLPQLLNQGRWPRAHTQQLSRSLAAAALEKHSMSVWVILGVRSVLSCCEILHSLIWLSPTGVWCLVYKSRARKFAVYLIANDFKEISYRIGYLS
jgi:hypothetical protein